MKSYNIIFGLKNEHDARDILTALREQWGAGAFTLRHERDGWSISLDDCLTDSAVGSMFYFARGFAKGIEAI